MIEAVVYRLKVQFFIIIAIFVAILSCSKKNSNLPNPQETNLHVFREQEAKLIDIPIPFGSKPLKRYTEQIQESENIMLGYENEMPANALQNFYVQEMERFGWQQEALCTGPEFVLLFSRPGKISIISLRPQTNGTTEFIICAQILKIN